MIKRFKNITFIGTSHISSQSVKSVEQTIKKQRPFIIALELDRARFQAIISKKTRKLKFSDIKKIGFKGFLFNLLGSWIEHKLSKATQTPPGSEMKMAIKLAKKQKIKLALIDQNINTTLKGISKTITWKERFTFLKDLIKLIFTKNKLKLDLKKVPSERTISKLISKAKKDYPSLHKILITERDLYMSKALYKISTNNPSKKILAIIGAGHIKGTISNLKKEKWPKKKRTGKK